MPAGAKVVGQGVEKRPFDGGFVARRSSTGSTMPRPIRSPQTRLTITFAKNGLSAEVTPVGQRLARVAVRVEGARVTGERLRREHLARDRVPDLALGGCRDELFAARNRGDRPVPL